MKDWTPIIRELDLEIQAGRSDRARSRLRKLGSRRCPRKDRAYLANVARRAGLPAVAIRLLNPLVYPLERGSRPTDREKLEYAASLSRIGAIPEALGLLESVDSSKHPEADLYQALALFTRWDYQLAIPHLERYEKRVENDYQRLVSWVNLAAALIYEQRTAEAFAFIERAKKGAKERNAVLLYGNCLELEAQGHLAEKAYSRAKRALSEGLAGLARTDSLDAFFLRKWEAILELRKSKGSASSLKDLRAIHREARERQHWESLRDCDFHLATVLKDEALFRHLYFGTPFASYRSKLLEEFQNGAAPGATYRWSLGEGPAAATLDARTGAVAGTPHCLRAGGLPLKLLGILSSDFYRPFRLPMLFSSIFPGEHFDPDHSLIKTHRVISRLRTWLEERDIPLRIDENRAIYRFASDERVSIIVALDSGASASEDSWRIQLRKLQGNRAEKSLSANEVAKLLGVSKRSAIRLLNSACDAGEAEKTGSGRLIRYLLRDRHIPQPRRS